MKNQTGTQNILIFQRLLSDLGSDTRRTAKEVVKGKINRIRFPLLYEFLNYFQNAQKNNVIVKVPSQTQKFCKTKHIFGIERAIFMAVTQTIILGKWRLTAVKSYMT